jgi:hypothetical protein
VRFYEGSLPKLIEVVRIPAHHAETLIEPPCVVIGAPGIVFLLVSELELDPVLIKVC